MKRRQVLRLALGAGALAGAGASAGMPPRHWRRRALVGFGTTLTLQAGHDDERVLEAALDEAVATLRSLERQMSLFDPDSALSRLNRAGRLDDPPDDLRAVLARARDIAAASDGAFDVTVQPLWSVWADAVREGRQPSAGEVQAARRR
ncbi:MAG TPA: FAD:protein FMN transferase, partial [Albitalea sp.]